MKAKSHVFDQWFVAQFGKRPDRRKLYDIEKAASDARYAARKLDHICDQVTIWEDRRNAAYKAYLAGKDGIKCSNK